MDKKFEDEFNAAFQQAVEAKRLFLADAVEKEAATLHGRIGLDDWDEEQRLQAYQREVLPFWEKFGQAPKRMWFELYGSREHRMDPHLVPADLYYNGLLPYLNHGAQQPGLMNKGYVDYLFSDVKRPETVALNIEGVYTDEKRTIISEETAIGLCRECGGTLFLKPSIDTVGGDGITVFEPGACTDEEIRRIFKKAGSAFIVQKRIKQHPQIDAINPSSVSTIRILSFLLEGEVSIVSAVLRVSSPDRPYVSMGDGGFYAEILDGGRLYPKAYHNNGAWIDQKNGLFDDSFMVPSMDKVCEEVERIHPRVAHFKCVGWDFAVDDQGDPVLIEFNVFPGIVCSQLTCCRPIFGDKTAWILEDYFLHRKLEQKHRLDMLIR